LAYSSSKEKLFIVISVFAFLIIIRCGKNTDTEANPTPASSITPNPEATAVATPSPTVTPTPTPVRLQISGVTDNGVDHGIFDAAISKDSSSRLWMSYSQVKTSSLWAQNLGVITRFGYSDNNGLSWTDYGSIINNFTDVTIPLGPPSNAGTWINEVSSIVYDAGAVPNEKWKLIWHHYLLINADRRFEHGWIGLKMASSPGGLLTSTEIKLFGSAGYDSVNNTAGTAGGITGSPVGGAPLIPLNTIHSALNNCLFSEPGLYSTVNALYASILCKQLATPYDSLIVLLKCSSPCNISSAGSWQYLGTALNETDAAMLGAEYDSGYSAPQLAESGGQVYLLATPTKSPNDTYGGCKVFKFLNLETATLERTAGVPNIIKEINGSVGSFNGACTYHAASTGSGIIYSQTYPNDSEIFRLFLSGINL
jgi:hypothetical protein